jgi:hypothetical protein
MKKLVSRVLVAALVIGLASFATVAYAHDHHGEEASWTGTVTDSGCGEKGAKAGHADCAHSCVKNKGAKYALYTPADKKVWILSDQEGAMKLAGQEVVVKGKADAAKMTIEVSSIELAKK